jgi:hypothetical protein
MGSKGGGGGQVGGIIIQVEGGGGGMVGGILN